MAVKFTKVAEIRRVFVDELVKIPARTKNGQHLDAMEFRKMYYNAEMDGEAVLLRVRDGVEIDRGHVKGDMVEAVFDEVGVESDVSQMYVKELRPVSSVPPSKK